MARAARCVLRTLDSGLRRQHPVPHPSLSVAVTYRRSRNASVLEFLTTCFRAWLDGSRTPNLLPSEAPSAAAA
ncbi:MAG: hypothetical protein ABSA26_02390 [Thermoguttaceae bacterium]